MSVIITITFNYSKSSKNKLFFLHNFEKILLVNHNFKAIEHVLMPVIYELKAKINLRI